MLVSQLSPLKPVTQLQLYAATKSWEMTVHGTSVSVFIPILITYLTCPSVTTRKRRAIVDIGQTSTSSTSSPPINADFISITITFVMTNAIILWLAIHIAVIAIVVFRTSYTVGTSAGPSSAAYYRSITITRVVACGIIAWLTKCSTVGAIVVGSTRRAVRSGISSKAYFLSTTTT